MKFSEYNKQNQKEIDWASQFDFDSYNLISEARLQTGLTQKQLADLIGTKQPGIARIENGTTLPSLSLLKRIALAINTTLVAPKFEFMQSSDQIVAHSDRTSMTMDEILSGTNNTQVNPGTESCVVRA